jgi:hypothetical protein
MWSSYSNFIDIKIEKLLYTILLVGYLKTKKCFLKVLFSSHATPEKCCNRPKMVAKGKMPGNQNNFKLPCHPVPP